MSNMKYNKNLTRYYNLYYFIAITKSKYDLEELQ